MTKDGTAINSDALHTVELLFARQGKHYPYYAIYEAALPLQPRIAAGTWKRIFYAESPDKFYSGVTSADYTEQVDIQRQSLLFYYQDATNGSHMISASLRTVPTEPRIWLRQRGFINHDYAQLDADLLRLLNDLLQQSTVKQQVVKKQQRIFFLATPTHGDLMLELSPTSVVLRSYTKQATRSDTLFRFQYGEDRLPLAADPRKTLKSNEVKTPKQDIQKLTGDVNYVSLMSAFGNDNETTISIDQARQIARQFGYLMPSDHSTTLVQATTYFSQLSLKLASMGKTYTVIQYPSGSRPRDDAPLQPAVRGRRKINGYTVLEIQDPVTHGRFVYYVRGDTTLVVPEADFGDQHLDQLIRSFAPVTEVHSQRRQRK